MSSLTSFQLVAAAVYLIPGFAWAVVAQNGWRFLWRRHPNSQFFRLLPIVGTLAALAYALMAVIRIVPPDVQQSRGLVIAVDCILFAVLAAGRHMAQFFPNVGEPRGGTWLAVNYGSALLAIAVAVLFYGLVPTPTDTQRFAYLAARVVYQLVVIGLIVARLIRVARPGAWRPGGPLFARRADIVVLCIGFCAIGLALVLSGIKTEDHNVLQPRWGVVIDSFISFALVTPLAVRILGEVVRAFVIAVVMLVATGLVYFGIHRLAALAGSAEALLLDLVAVGALVLVLVPGQFWLRAGIDHVVLRRSRRRREVLQRFLHTLSPQSGAAECCRRAVEEVTRVMQLRGAAVLLRTGEVVSHGALATEPLERVWPSDVDPESFPSGALVGYELRELPPRLLDALSDTDIVGVFPIVSPRQRWGLLAVSTGLVGVNFTDEDQRVLQAFTDQLALVLDGADLLARAVAVERSLAHSEKLAAIGELAARIAHEIRNPVTAARSLAQQLAQEPVSPLNAEHAGLILTELERVERQVAALLRFARREEFRFEPVDIGALMRATLEEFQARLERAGIEVEVHATDGIMARADREKIRQVLINLIENAMDALTEVTASKRLTVTLAGANGAAELHVTDNGPGVSADTLAQLFEPFLSLKAKGTGLGLAIAKRTVEAHGGRIEAHRATDGMTFQVTLPISGLSTQHSALRTQRSGLPNE